MCADCRHNTHGVQGRNLTHADDPDGLDELVEELGATHKKSAIMVYNAEYATNCPWEDCHGRIRVGDRIAKDPDHGLGGWVHAEHLSV